jgi:hypothetical protein
MQQMSMPGVQVSAVLGLALPALAPASGARILTNIGRLSGALSPSAAAVLSAPATEALRAQQSGALPPSAAAELSPSAIDAHGEATAAVEDISPVQEYLVKLEEQVGRRNAANVQLKAVEDEIQILSDIRKQKLRHADLALYLMLFAVGGGTVVLLGGVGLAVWANTSELAGVVTSVVGAITAFSGRVPGKLYRENMDRVEKTEKDLTMLRWAHQNAASLGT